MMEYAEYLHMNPAYPVPDVTYNIPALTGQEYGEIHSIIADGGDRFGVSVVSFDCQQELLWMGNTGGHVTSYYGAGLQKYTSFQIHATNEIRQILSIDTGILSLTRNDLKCSARGGLVIFNFNSDKMKDMQCMLTMDRTSLLMGGHQDDLMIFDIEKKEIITSVNIEESSCAILRHHPRFVCSGDTSGKICLRDPSSLKAQHTLEAHSGCLSDFDVSGNLLVTAGFSSRMGSLTMDRFLKVYDLRVMRAINPLQLMFDPLLLRFIPTYTSRLAVCSQTGQFQLVEADGPLTSSSMVMYQVNTAGTQCMTFDCSSSCQALAFGDAGGYVHLFGTNDNVSFNPYSNPTEFAEPVELIHSIQMADELTPLSTIPLPLCSDAKLLSNFPASFTEYSYRKSPAIDPEILRTMKMVQSVGYAPKPAGMLCNQVPYKLNKYSKGRGSGRTRQFSVPDSPALPNSVAVNIPKRYPKVLVKFTKMGVDEFDFNRYNRTCFSGLEAVLPNAYCNCMLQVLYFCEPIRCAALNHSCDKEFCLTCELGFLFHMLDISQGMPCQASNFLRTFRSIPEAAALGLVLPENDEAVRKNLNFRRLIQSWNRFILSQLNSEMLRPKMDVKRAETHSDDELDEPAEASQARISRRRYNSGEKSVGPMTATKSSSIIGSKIIPKNNNLTDQSKTIISKMFGAETITVNTCRCSSVKSQNSLLFLCFLMYPDFSSYERTAMPTFSFTDVLAKSLCSEQTMQAWCDSCNKYQTTAQTKKLANLPEILVVNCGLESEQNLELWKAQIQNQEAYNTSTEVSGSKHKEPCRYGSGCNRIDCKFSHEIDNESKDTEEVAEQDNISSSWLPTFVKIKLNDDGTVVVNSCTAEEMTLTTSELDDRFVLYELTSVTSHVIDLKGQGKDNLVSCVKVGGSYHQRTGSYVSSDLNQWYLFNDFSVHPISEEESVWLSLDWKIPCFLYYCRKDLNSRNNIEIVTPFTSEVFNDDKSLAAKASQKVTFMPLSPEETPTEGEIVAMDAEFVTLNQEEAVLRSDGTRSMIKPCQMSVARITCIRGHGEHEGVPFIDDYISTQEQVVDYVTKFSGIKPGDLDATVSSKHLTTLKSTYKKLRYLVDNKVRFVGHGLKNDFRVINLVVPPEQVHDTVLLFQLPKQRFVSLRFLAWHFLGLKIQSIMHDSVEDAKTALKLYREYEGLSGAAAGKINEALRELYENGRNLQWKVPGTDATAILL